VLRSVFRSSRVLIGLTIVGILVVCAIFAPLIAPHDPNEQNLVSILLPPAWSEGGDPSFLLGTDSLGRDVLSRLIFGARVAMTVAVLASLGAMIVGAVLAYLGVGLRNVIFAIVAVDWTRFCRVIRSEVLVVRRKDYIAAAQLMGFSHPRVIVKEIVPATLPLLITLLSMEMGIAVIVEAILSFVGMSVSANTPAWGQMVADARQTIYEAPWNLFLPIFAIFLAVLGFNILGDGLRRTLDVRLIARGRT